MNRDIYKNVGNTNGKDIYCRRCNEPWENTYIVEDFTDAEWNRYVILGGHDDEPDSEEHTCIVKLKGCPSCRKMSEK